MIQVCAIYNSERNKIYIGQTSNVEERLKRHNQQLVSKKTSYTKKLSGEWKLVYSELLPTRQEARVREKQLKSAKGREFVWTIVRKDRP